MTKTQFLNDFPARMAQAIAHTPTVDDCDIDDEDAFIPHLSSDDDCDPYDDWLTAQRELAIEGYYERRRCFPEDYQSEN